MEKSASKVERRSAEQGERITERLLKEHLGFYPTSSGIEAFAKELSGYKTSRGAAQFPYRQPIPYDLVDKITRFRVAEEVARKNPQGK